ncbi:MAG: phosphatidate cytidylyltransferase [Lachnospiraceae bacterium]|jgi:phosphatidate cytidylyltransferase|nr:phosphatidate cytidylyltransferase [Lachnospiraceae bacterium]
MFKQRAVSAVVLVIVLLFFLIVGELPLFFGVLAISLIAFFEMTRATGVHTEGKFMNALETVGVVGICVYYISIKNGIHPYTMFALLVTISFIMMVYVFTFPEYHADQVMAMIFSVIYAPVMLSFLYLTRQLKGGVYLVWLTFIGSWICDTCAYLVGRKLGKHKLAPVLSPKKSVEGAVGGVAGAALVGFIYAVVLVHYQVVSEEMRLVYPVITTVCSLFSQVGDLAASGIKRNHEIKDYGKLIPGHGGIMDRFDSVIFIAPIIYYLAGILGKV